MRKKIYILFISILSSQFCYTQNKNIDSLLNLLKIDKEDSNKVNHLNELAYLVRHSNPDSTILLSTQSILLSEKLIKTSHLKLGIGYSNAVGNIAIGYRLKGDYPKAKEYYFKVLKIDEELDYKFGIGKRLVGISNLYNNQANYPKALEYGLKSLEVNEGIKNKRAIALSYSILGDVYFNQQDYNRSLEFELKTVKTFEDIDDKNNTQETLDKIGIIYKELKDYSKALEYLFRTLKIAEDNTLGQLNAQTLRNIGSVYLEKKDYQSALEYYYKALNKDSSLAIKGGIANDYNYIGHLLAIQKKFTEAEKYLLDGVKINKQIGALNSEMFAENELSQLYEVWNQPAEALKHYKIAAHLKDSIYNKNNTQKIMNLEFEKKETETKAEQAKLDAISLEEKQKQQIITYSVAGVLLIVIIFSVLLYKRFRLTNHQKKIIEIKSKETEEQKQIIEEKNKEVMDSIRYASRIQRALITSEVYINNQLNKLMKN